MAQLKEITCKCGCGKKKFVYESDLKRGFGMFYNHSCASKYRRPARRVRTSKSDKISFIFNEWLKSHVKCCNRGIKS